MKKFSILLFMLTAFIFTLSPAGRDDVPSAAGEISITDSTGNTVHLDGLPQRITFAGKASNIVADALYMFPEAAERIVGVGNTDQFNGAFARLLDPRFDEKFYYEHSAGAEQLVTSKPDLVILKNYLKGSLGDPLGQIGIPVIYLHLEQPEYYDSDLKMLGEIFGDPGRGEELAEYYSSGMKYVTDRTDRLTDRPGVLFLYHATKDGVSSFSIPPGEWIQTRMVSMAGGDPVWTGSHPGDGWSKVNMEQIAAWNPDQVYIVAYKENVDKVLDDLKASPQWQEMKALKNNRIEAFPVDYYSWDQPDSRWIIGLKWLAKQIHPELFQDLDIREMTRSFYRDIYNLPDEQFDREIASRLGWNS